MGYPERGPSVRLMPPLPEDGQNHHVRRFESEPRSQHASASQAERAAGEHSAASEVTARCFWRSDARPSCRRSRRCCRARGQSAPPTMGESPNFHAIPAGRVVAGRVVARPGSGAEPRGRARGDAGSVGVSAAAFQRAGAHSLRPDG